MSQPVRRGDIFWANLDPTIEVEIKKTRPVVVMSDDAINQHSRLVIVVPLMAAAIELVRMYSNIELVWASPRELLNIFQADAIGYHIIAVTNDILKKLEWVGRDFSTSLQGAPWFTMRRLTL